MTQKRDDMICTIGYPRTSEAGKEVVAFHLHRYLSLWLRRYGLRQVLVSVGFQGSMAQSVTYAVSQQSAEVVEVRWGFEDLCHTHQYGGGRLRIENVGADDGYESLGFLLVPVYDDLGPGEGRPGLLAFALFVEGEGPGDAGEGEAATQIAEALRASRRNSMRLFFDEKKHLPMKAFLYDLLDHLPEWVGCDHSASLILTANLDAMTLEGGGESGGQARFGVLAERIFFCDASTPCARLVGMEIGAGGESGILADAVEVQRREPEKKIHIYEKLSVDEQGWFAKGGDEHGHDRFHHVKDRPREGLFVLVPLMVEEGGQYEMLGFLSLAYREVADLPRSAKGLLEELSAKLSDVLRYSPLYMLSAHKMWILGQTRSALERHLRDGKQDPLEVLETYIGEVTHMISRHVDVPSMAIAYLFSRSEVPGRTLRYVHPHGWTQFEGLELAVDVAPDARADSGVSVLAVRLGRYLVLAGGYGEGEGQGFKNDLLVNEEAARVIDGRSPMAEAELERGRWVPLKDYYKPARETAYATLAYPVIFADRVLGVVTIEVERDTDWLWWTGFGGQLFWQWLAADLAYAFHALGVEAGT